MSCCKDGRKLKGSGRTNFSKRKLEMYVVRIQQILRPSLQSVVDAVRLGRSAIMVLTSL